MKRELALQLLQTILPHLADESNAAQCFRELQFLADYKYNKYEMYHPGRLFLENLYLWLQQFTETERQVALDFIRTQLIFISREEVQQLAHVLYNDRIRKEQLNIAAEHASLPQYRVRAIRDSAAFARTTRASLYVGMSDGARLDYIRRHNLDINNEQVLPYYAVHEEKIAECLQALRVEAGDPTARFRCLFLIDDFAGSGNTLLREVASVSLSEDWKAPAVPPQWQGRLKFKGPPPAMEIHYRGELTSTDLSDLYSLDKSETFHDAIQSIAAKCQARDTIIKGSLHKVATGRIAEALEPNANIFFCPLLTTEYGLGRLKPLLARLPGQFSQMKILEGASIDSRLTVRDASSPIGALCEKYYDVDLADQHTGNIKFGYDNCGLPLVLHHNTPNNSLFLLWARRSERLAPLFVRYERHGREGL